MIFEKPEPTMKMPSFIQMMERNVAIYPHSTAVSTSSINIDYEQLWMEVNKARTLLRGMSSKRFALSAANSIAWIVLDLAAIKENITIVPVPHFFTIQQIQHMMQDANVEVLVSDRSSEIDSCVNSSFQGEETYYSILDVDLSFIPLHKQKSHNPITSDDAMQSANRKICKISYTSGTTGDPKGVYITFDSINSAVQSLVQTIGKDAAEKHLCALPFSLLLENIAGMYTVLASAGCCLIQSSSELGMFGSSTLDLKKFTDVIEKCQPTSMITVPALLKALVSRIPQLNGKLDSFKFIAVGGAPISKKILMQAEEHGLPVFEGYGSTECGSVVCLNTPESRKLGSVGKPLPHISIQTDEEGEIIISGAEFIGYSSSTAASTAGNWAAGDLGFVDEQGFVHITARKSSSYSTAFGRNVAPEWVESELNGEEWIAQSAVFGAGQSHNVAVIVPPSPTIEEQVLAIAVDNVNQRLPDYAMIGEWFRTDQPFCLENRQLMPSGAICRDRIRADYNGTIEQLLNMSEETLNEVL